MDYVRSALTMAYPSSVKKAYKTTRPPMMAMM